ncbi:hypothetical protein J6A31_09060 [bacterium]|nr:hypothetical protein [bacterium]
MKLMTCKTIRKTLPAQITEGQDYWVDEESMYTDPDGDTYADVYTDYDKKHKVGHMLISHFADKTP